MRIEVSLSPALYPYRTLTEHHTTVAIDVLRATTAICAAFQAGCIEVVPLDNLEALEVYRPLGYHLAAERNGEKVAGAEYGNSPTEYLRYNLAGQRIAYSTTNGTVSILRAADADLTLVGAFANIHALAARLQRDAQDVVLLCSGWKNDFCLEDTLVAGALIEALGNAAQPHGDAAAMASSLWKATNGDPLSYCANASHVLRLQRLGAEVDIPFAFKQDTCPVVPVLKNGTLTL